MLSIRRRFGGTVSRTALVVLAASVALTGCSAEHFEQFKVGYMPSDHETTNHTGMIINLWNGSWIAGLAVGVIVWALVLGCAFVYRRREGDGIPPQLRYNVPLEVMYTVIPLFMVGAFFVLTEQGFSDLEARDPDPDVKVQVIGKQWAWDFNYTDAGVYETSQQVYDVGTAEEDQLPTLYLPVDNTVEITLNARDVIHSFWVPAFLYKKDMIPGRTNYMTFTPTKEGTFAGKCAELCGEYHSEMLFQVKVVSEADYEQYLDGLREKGNVGELPLELSREGLMPVNGEYGQGVRDGVIEEGSNE